MCGQILEIARFGKIPKNRAAIKMNKVPRPPALGRIYQAAAPTSHIKPVFFVITPNLFFPPIQCLPPLHTNPRMLRTLLPYEDFYDCEEDSPEEKEYLLERTLCARVSNHVYNQLIYEFPQLPFTQIHYRNLTDTSFGDFWRVRHALRMPPPIQPTPPRFFVTPD